MKRSSLITVAIFVLASAVCSFALEVGDTLVIPASKFKNDGHWDSKSWCRHGYKGRVWVVHKPAKKNVEGKMEKDFPGPSGTYDVGVGIHWKCNGRSPWEVRVNGKKIGGGLTPWAKTRCKCKQYGDDCLPLPGGVAQGVKIKKGDKITYWGKIAWNQCGQGGVYSGWYQLMFKLVKLDDAVAVRRNIRRFSREFEPMRSSAAGFDVYGRRIERSESPGSPVMMLHPVAGRYVKRVGRNGR